jgi:hypothetical protein
MKTLIIACLLTLGISVGASVGINSWLDEADTVATPTLSAWSVLECSTANSELKHLHTACAAGTWSHPADTSACAGEAQLQIAIATNCP